MNSNFYQWIAIGISFIPAIIIYFRPRMLRRLFQHKVKFIQEDDRGRRSVYGYVVAWSIVPTAFQPVQNKTFALCENIPPVPYLIIEPKRPHPKLGYQHFMVEVKFVIFC